MRLSVLLAATLMLAACDPAQVADKVGRRAAETVVQPVMAGYMTGPQADTATRCIVDNASADQVQALAQDVGVGAGPRTLANIRAAAANPGAMACMAAAGIPPIGG